MLKETNIMSKETYKACAVRMSYEEEDTCAVPHHHQVFLLQRHPLPGLRT
jgi:hypothetical protein